MINNIYFIIKEKSLTYPTLYQFTPKYLMDEIMAHLNNVHFDSIPSQFLISPSPKYRLCFLINYVFMG